MCRYKSCRSVDEIISEDFFSSDCAIFLFQVFENFQSVVITSGAAQFLDETQRIRTCLDFRNCDETLAVRVLCQNGFRSLIVSLFGYTYNTNAFELVLPTYRYDPHPGLC